MTEQSVGLVVAGSKVAPSRVGKKGVTFYLEKDALKQLRSICLDEELTQQALMVESLNLLFRSRGLEEIAK
jgi:hypothetical protein